MQINKVASVLLTLICFPTVLWATPVLNPSFELNGGFVERIGFPRLDDVNGSAPTFWTSDNTFQAEYVTRVPAYLGVTLYNPAHGDFNIAMHGGEWWEQTFTTTPGTTYSLEYSVAWGAVWREDVANVSGSYFRPGSTSGTVTLTGNVSLFSSPLMGTGAAPSGTTPLDSPFVWSQKTGTFTADSLTTTLRFSGPADINAGFIFVDQVAVTAIPEPGVFMHFVAIGLPLLVWRNVKMAQRHRFRQQDK